MVTFFYSISRLHKLHKYRHILKSHSQNKVFFAKHYKNVRIWWRWRPLALGQVAALWAGALATIHSGRMQAVRRAAAAAAFSMQSPLSPRRAPCAAVVVVVPPVLSFFLPWNDCANAAVEMQGGPCRPPIPQCCNFLIRSQETPDYMGINVFQYQMKWGIPFLVFSELFVNCIFLITSFIYKNRYM